MAPSFENDFDEAGLDSEKCVVVTAHDASDVSQLPLRVGEIITVLEKDETGWWGGHKEGEDFTGWFPGHCVRALTHEDVPPKPQPAPEPDVSPAKTAAAGRRTGDEKPEASKSPVQFSQAVTSALMSAREQDPSLVPAAAAKKGEGAEDGNALRTWHAGQSSARPVHVASPLTGSSEDRIARDEAAALRSQVERIQEECEDAQRKRDAYIEELKREREAREKAVREREELTRQLQMEKELREQSQREHAAAEDRRKRLEQEQAAKEERFQIERQKLQSEATTNKRLQEQHENLQQQLATVGKRLEEQHENLQQQLEKERRASQSHLDAHREEMERLQRTHQEEHRRVQERVSRAEERASRAEVKTRHLEGELEAMSARRSSCASSCGEALTPAGQQSFLRSSTDANTCRRLFRGSTGPAPLPASELSPGMQVGRRDPGCQAPIAAPGFVGTPRNSTTGVPPVMSPARDAEVSMLSLPGSARQSQPPAPPAQQRALQQMQQQHSQPPHRIGRSASQGPRVYQPDLGEEHPPAGLVNKVLKDFEQRFGTPVRSQSRGRAPAANPVAPIAAPVAQAVAPVPRGLPVTQVQSAPTAGRTRLSGGVPTVRPLNLSVAGIERRGSACEPLRVNDAKKGNEEEVLNMSPLSKSSAQSQPLRRDLFGAPQAAPESSSSSSTTAGSATSTAASNAGVAPAPKPRLSQESVQPAQLPSPIEAPTSVRDRIRQFGSTSSLNGV
eukprot:TRINITY_DN508_c0_g1_i1.p1 TRINITY_DN508_c0_g1~~TRINITY_DN508_c0_g1_i1.p1  ORF type:complete len:732 (-),score=202.76 TRINITY_DN508_c0_g1_i1:451-2646(-)